MDRQKCTAILPLSVPDGEGVVDMAIHNQEIFVCSYTKIYKYDLSGRELSCFSFPTISRGRRPNQLRVNNGIIYVSWGGYRGLSLISSDGKLISSLQTPFWVESFSVSKAGIVISDYSLVRNDLLLFS